MKRFGLISIKKFSLLLIHFQFEENWMKWKWKNQEKKKKKREKGRIPGSKQSTWSCILTYSRFKRLNFFVSSRFSTEETFTSAFVVIPFPHPIAGYSDVRVSKWLVLRFQFLTHAVFSIARIKSSCRSCDCLCCYLVFCHSGMYLRTKKCKQTFS